MSRDPLTGTERELLKGYRREQSLRRDAEARLQGVNLDGSARRETQQAGALNDDALYYAQNGEVRKRSIATKESGGTSYTLDFAICRVSECVGDDAAKTVADLMNAGHKALNAAPAPAGLPAALVPPFSTYPEDHAKLAELAGRISANTYYHPNGEAAETPEQLAELVLAILDDEKYAGAPAAEPAAEVLNGIAEALESRGYAHMANGRDIGLLLDELEELRSGTAAARDADAALASASEMGSAN